MVRRLVNEDKEDPMEYLIAHIGHTQKHHEHVTWWKPDSRGYTICIDKAGRYSEAQALSICRTGENIGVPVNAVQPLARSTPYYRQSSGKLAGLYDGGPHRPVPNSRDAWSAILSLRVFPSHASKTEKPTPMPPSKMRAIYIDGVPA